MIAVHWTKRAKKELAGLDAKHVRQIAAAVQALAAASRSDTKRLHGKLAGQDRLRVGEWRVYYRRSEGNLYVLRVVNRSEAYR